jgi:hypothetical protein
MKIRLNILLGLLILGASEEGAPQEENMKLSKINQPNPHSSLINLNL